MMKKLLLTGLLSIFILGNVFAQQPQKEDIDIGGVEYEVITDRKPDQSQLAYFLKFTNFNSKTVTVKFELENYNANSGYHYTLKTVVIKADSERKWDTGVDFDPYHNIYPPNIRKMVVIPLQD